MVCPASLSRRKVLGALLAAPMLAACGADLGPARRSSASSSGARVALLLPLSGDRAGLGKRMAKAVWLVEDSGGTPGRTDILDAGATPQTAAKAAQDAVSRDANVIVGPLFGAQTPAVVAAAGAVPVLSLSNDVSVASSGAWVFGVTPAQSVQTVTDFAQAKGSKRIAILETQGALGQRAQSALRDAARKRRLKPLPSVPKDTAPTDMPATLKSAGGGTMPDILYVPSTDPQALAQAEAAVRTGITTIGSLQWSGLGQSQLSRLDKACFTGPDPVRFDRLSAHFRAALDEEMGVIAALAVDAVDVARGFAGRRPPVGGAGYDGLLGKTRFDRNRTCQRDLAILRIDGGRVVPVV